jgi:NAD(P)-dependent dehydrogenase (short-subunit alcohol dehydrogenase family)
MQKDSKVAIVTGGASGIGKVSAIELAKNGLRIAVIDVNEENGKKVTEEINKTIEAKFFYCDLTSVDQIRTTVEAIANDFGRIDVLLNCAAITNRDRSHEITEEQWDKFMALDLKSPFFMAQSCASHMSRVGGGRIINFSSMRSIIADGKHILYGCAKSALNAMTRELAVDYCKDNIQVNAVLPSYVITPLNEMLLDQPGWEEEQLGYSLNLRLLWPKDIASVVVFLATCETPMVNGTCIYTDSGYLNFKYKAFRERA